MHLNENFTWFLFFLIAFILIYGYRIIHTRALKALANTARIQSNPRSLKRLNQKIKKGPPSFIGTLIGVFFTLGLAFAFYKYYEWNRINTISKFQAIATNVMQNDCTAHCSAYGITQNKLIGPQLEQDCCYGSDSHPDYIFTWQSNNPKVTLKERVYTSGIKAAWFGTRIQEDIEATNLVRNDVDTIIQQNQNIIDAAYQHALESTPSMHASFAIIHLTIAPNGQVTDSNMILTDINSVEFKNNLLKVFSNMHFSSGHFQTTYFTYRLPLQPI